MTCRTCKHLLVFPDKSGRRVPRRNNAYKCLAPLPEVEWPHSVSRACGFQPRPSKIMMCPDMGEGCPAYEQLTKER